jgi:pimeloyl-ACP methyl ester carboxylesterase
MKTFSSTGANLLAGGVVALAGMALLNWGLAKRAEARNPPLGQFVKVNGTNLHYVERGAGTPIVLLHGNGTMLQDFVASGLLDSLATDHRVIAFDRPGFGYSERPRGVVWDPDAQAELIYAGLRQLGVGEAIVLGHSWGTLVALALASKYPEATRMLILVSGYYFPTPRLDGALAIISATPVIGTVLSHTIAPIVSRAISPLIARKLFGPRPIPSKFGRFPSEMAVRPSQLKSVAEEAALMVPAVSKLQHRYEQLTMPVVIVTGSDDRIINPAQSHELSTRIRDSLLMSLPGHGHMVHQTATSNVLKAIKDGRLASLPALRREPETAVRTARRP